MNLVLSILSIVSALLSGKALVSSVMVYRRTRSRFQAVSRIFFFLTFSPRSRVIK